MITVPIYDTRTNTTQTSLVENDVINEIHQMIDEIYLNYIRINHLSESEKKRIETIFTNLRTLIMTIISSLNERIVTLNNDISNLKKEVSDLQQKQIEVKRFNIISEILSPLKRYIFRQMSNSNIPTCYYNVNVLKLLYWLNKGDVNSTNYYLDVYKMNNESGEQALTSLKNVICSFSSSEYVCYTLLVLLIEKEKRNFEEYSTITDFIRDSYQTNDSRLTSLLRQQGVLSAFQLTEIDAMDKIYTKYFGHLANHR